MHTPQPERSVSARGRFLAYSLMALGTIAYFAFSITLLHLPGLQYDELLFVNGALGNIDGNFISWDVEIAGRRIPLILMRYIGALKALLYTPIFALFGTSAAAVRLPVVLVGLATLVFTYRLVRDMLGKREALVAFVLLASDPAFIFANRLDWGPVSLMLALKMSSLYLLWRWLQTGRLRLLGLASFLLGLGLFDKVTFAWFLGALGVAFPLCFAKELRARWSRRAPAVALGCFILGSWPLIAYNVKSQLETFRHEQGLTTDWRDLVYRYRLFETTLDGTAVLDHVNHGAPAEAARALPDTLQAIGLGQRSLNWYAVLLSIAAVTLKSIHRVLKHSERALFFLVVCFLVSAAICITAQGTGPHHAAFVFPFTHILVACALCAVLPHGSGRLPNAARHAAVGVVFMALWIPQLALGVGYLRSFSALGGVGIWSDAIYDLASWTASKRDRTFLLMDWGFSNQLLALSPGIRKEESFVPLIDIPDSEKRVAAMDPHLVREGVLFVFHSPMFETFSLLDTFRRAAELRGLAPRLVQPFFQRDGRPVYLVYEVVRPPAQDTFARNGRLHYLREAEACDARSGGTPEPNVSASGAGMLGGFWGRSLSDAATYMFQLPSGIRDPHLYIRYAFGDRNTQEHFLLLYLDGRAVDVIPLQRTGGAGYTPLEWGLGSRRLGMLDKGRHEIVLRPAAAYQDANIDCFYISQGPLWPAHVASLPEAAAEHRPLSPDVLAFLERNDVRLQVEPAVIVAGESTMGLRLENLKASAFDLVYSIDGKLMPPILGWRLGKDQTSSVFVDRNTPRGIYRYHAIRDSSRPSPTEWIHVDVQVQVR
jgi:hypothetical protein